MAKKDTIGKLRSSINKKCKECIYDKNSPGTWIEQVFKCTSKECPLYSVRPIGGRKEKVGKS